MSLLDTLNQQRTRLNIEFTPDGASASAPARFLAVEQAGGGRWNVVDARIDGGTVAVLAAYRLDEETLRGGIAEALAPASGRKLLLIPDSRQAVCRLLDMPDVPQPQLEQMVALRLEVELPYPPAESTWVCTRLPAAEGAHGPVVLIAAATKHIENTESRLTFEGYPGARIVFAPAGLVELARAGEAPGETVAVARIDGEHALLAIGRGGVLCYARHARLEPPNPGGNGAPDVWTAALARELKQCLLDYSVRTGSPAPARLNVAGNGIVTGEQCEALRNHLDVPAHFVEAPGALNIEDPEAIEGDLLRDYAIPVGALLSLCRQRQGLRPAAPALRREGRQGAFQVRRSTLKLIAVNAALLAAFAASIFAVQSIRLSADERFVRESKPVLSQLEALQEEVDILRFEERQRATVLDILLALSEVLPPELKVETLNMDTQGKLSISGTTQSVEAVSDNVTEALKKSTMFKNPQFKGATQGQQGFGFTLTCELAMGTTGAGL